METREKRRQEKIFIDILSRLVMGLAGRSLAHRCCEKDCGDGKTALRNEGKLHYHESWEIKIPVSGRLYCRFPGVEFNVPQNTVLLIAPHIIHYTTSTGDVSRCEDWFNCSLENGDVRLNLRRGDELIYYFLSSDQKSEFTFLLGQDPNAFCAQVAQVMRRMGEQPARQTAGAWFVVFLASLLNSLSAPAVSSPQHELVSRAMALLNNMSGDANLTVGGMASMLHISPKYLTAVFHRVTGITPRQKLIQIRLERACRMMRTGKFSVKEIAALTGWRNQFYFSNSFRRHYGLAPSRMLSRHKA